MSQIKKLFIITLTIVSAFIASIASATSPVGYWKTVDETGRPKSIIRIYQGRDKALIGQIVKTFNKGQPRAGTIIISGLTPDQEQWDNGKILDVNNGRTYSCHLRLADNGKKLDVIGYIGFPLLGKSQTWERVDLLSDTDKFNRLPTRS